MACPWPVYALMCLWVLRLGMVNGVPVTFKPQDANDAMSSCSSQQWLESLVIVSPRACIDDLLGLFRVSVAQFTELVPDHRRTSEAAGFLHLSYTGRLKPAIICKCVAVTRWLVVCNDTLPVTPLLNAHPVAPHSGKSGKCIWFHGKIFIEFDTK